MGGAGCVGHAVDEHVEEICVGGYVLGRPGLVGEAAGGVHGVVPCEG